MGAGSSRPSINYNAVTNRWEVRGKGGVLRMAIPDDNTPPVKFLSFVGSSAEIIAVGTSLPEVGTITNATGLKVGDKVFGNVKPVGVTGITDRIFGAFQVPTTDTLNFSVVNVADVAGSLRAAGWDILAVRTE